MKPTLRVIDPERTMRDVWLPCWCQERTGTPMRECRDCGGSGMHLTRLPAPPKEA